MNKKDKDIFNILEQYIETDSSEYLINSLEGKTEDILQYMLSNNFSTSELGLLKTLRGKKNLQFHKAFKKFSKEFNEDKLIFRLKEVVQDN